MARSNNEKADDVMVGPGGVPGARDFNGLVCPTGQNTRFELKREIRRLSSLTGAPDEAGD